MAQRQPQLIKQNTVKIFIHALEKGGKNGTTGGFAANHELAKIAGRKGGRISRRGPATTSTSTPISMIDESEESKIEVRVA